MANHILFVFEGERTEKQIVVNLTQYFLNEQAEKTLVLCAYCNDLYELHKEIANDDDVDTFSLLKEIPFNKHLLATYKRNDFAEIYLFFDYDGHDSIATDDKIQQVLAFFQEETERGKLFISYPMVEALKHVSEKIDFKALKVKAKENIGYKQIVGKESSYQQIKKYNLNTWKHLIQLHLCKLNHIVNEQFCLPNKLITQSEIFEWQLERYIKIDETVAVLSAFPVFIFDYYGHEHVITLLTREEV